MVSHLGALWPDNSNLLFRQSGHNYFAFPYFTVRLPANRAKKKISKKPSPSTGLRSYANGRNVGPRSSENHCVLAEKWALARCQESRVKCQEESAGSFISIQVKCGLDFSFCSNTAVFCLHLCKLEKIFIWSK